MSVSKKEIPEKVSKRKLFKENFISFFNLGLKNDGYILEVMPGMLSVITFPVSLPLQLVGAGVCTLVDNNTREPLKASEIEKLLEKIKSIESKDTLEIAKNIVHSEYKPQSSRSIKIKKHLHYYLSDNYKKRITAQAIKDCQLEKAKEIINENNSYKSASDELGEGVVEINPSGIKVDRERVNSKIMDMQGSIIKVELERFFKSEYSVGAKYQRIIKAIYDEQEEANEITQSL